MNTDIRNSKEGDIHTARRKWARLHKKGCNRHCTCKWCQDNRTFRSKRQTPIDDDGKILR